MREPSPQQQPNQRQAMCRPSAPPAKRDAPLWGYEPHAKQYRRDEATALQGNGGASAPAASIVCKIQSAVAAHDNSQPFRDHGQHAQAAPAPGSERRSIQQSHSAWLPAPGAQSGCLTADPARRSASAPAVAWQPLVPRPPQHGAQPLIAACNQQHAERRQPGARRSLSAAAAPPLRQADEQEALSQCRRDVGGSGLSGATNRAMRTARSASVGPRTGRPLSECTGVFSRETTADDDLDYDEVMESPCCPLSFASMTFAVTCRLPVRLQPSRPTCLRSLNCMQPVMQPQTLEGPSWCRMCGTQYFPGAQPHPHCLQQVTTTAKGIALQPRNRVSCMRGRKAQFLSMALAHLRRPMWFPTILSATALQPRTTISAPHCMLQPVSRTKASALDGSI